MSALFFQKPLLSNGSIMASLYTYSYISSTFFAVTKFCNMYYFFQKSSLLCESLHSLYLECIRSSFLSYSPFRKSPERFQVRSCQLHLHKGWHFYVFYANTRIQGQKLQWNRSLIGDQCFEISIFDLVCTIVLHMIFKYKYKELKICFPNSYGIFSWPI